MLALNTSTGGPKVRIRRFVYYKTCTAYQRHEILRKVVESFTHEVQCVRHDVQTRVPDDDTIDHQQHK